MKKEELHYIGFGFGLQYIILYYEDAKLLVVYSKNICLDDKSEEMMIIDQN